MAFQEKHEKVGGRQLGVPNKYTKELRDSLKIIVSNEISALPKYMEKLNEKEKLSVIIKLLPFILPKVEQVHYKEGEGIFPDWG